eukprot:15477309-Alexandrium_andersonii.AAC.1
MRAREVPRSPSSALKWPNASSTTAVEAEDHPTGCRRGSCLKTIDAQLRGSCSRRGVLPPPRRGATAHVRAG